jgi:hypothetical protein
MKFYLKFDGRPYLTLKYEGNEWQMFKELFEDKLKLRTATTSRAWGENIAVSYYKETSEQLKAYWESMVGNAEMGNGYHLIDEINYPLTQEHYINIALFRIIPTDNKVQVPLLKFLNVKELNTIMSSIRSFLEVVMNLVLEAEVEIKGFGSK